MQIKGVIFDLDGTLLDTSVGIIESAKYAAKSLGYEELSYSEMIEFVGPPIQLSFVEHYGCDVQTAQKAANIFRDYYKSTALLKAVPYPGIFELCGLLKSRGIKLAVATYKREDYALMLLEHFHFDDYADSMHGADNDGVLKKNDIVKLCQKDLSISGTDSVLVGDTLHDAIGAQKAETHFIGVTYGFGFKNKNEMTEYPNIGIAASPQEVGEIIING